MRLPLAFALSITTVTPIASIVTIIPLSIAFTFALVRCSLVHPHLYPSLLSLMLLFATFISTIAHVVVVASLLTSTSNASRNANFKVGVLGLLLCLLDSRPLALKEHTPSRLCPMLPSFLALHHFCLLASIYHTEMRWKQQK